MSATLARRTPSQRHFLTPEGTVAVYAGGTAHTLHICIYPNSSGREVRSANIVADDAREVALAVCAGDMTAPILADWFEDRGMDETAKALRHPDTVDKDSPRLFSLGDIKETPLARQACIDAGYPAANLYIRHQRGNWGTLSADDKAANDAAHIDGSRIISAYVLRTGVTVWVITEAEDDDGVRGGTTVLLPEEY